MGRERVKVFCIDETGIKIGGLEAFLFIAYEPFEDRILGLYFRLASKLDIRGAIPEGSIQEIRTPPCVDRRRGVVRSRMRIDECETPCIFARRVDVGGNRKSCAETQRRIESFDDTFPCRSYGEKCHLKHVWNWINVFFLHHQEEYQSFLEEIKLDLSLR